MYSITEVLSLQPIKQYIMITFFDDVTLFLLCFCLLFEYVIAPYNGGFLPYILLVNGSMALMILSYTKSYYYPPLFCFVSFGGPAWRLM